MTSHSEKYTKSWVQAAMWVMDDVMEKKRTLFVNMRQRWFWITHLSFFSVPHSVPLHLWSVVMV